jgi:hypothetical protein
MRHQQTRVSAFWRYACERRAWLTILNCHPPWVDHYFLGEIMSPFVGSSGLVRAATCITVIGVQSATRGLPSQRGARVVLVVRRKFTEDWEN